MTRTIWFCRFKTFDSAKATITGIELHHMLRKRQMKDSQNKPVWEQFFDLAA
jgi:putative transposase